MCFDKVCNMCQTFYFNTCLIGSSVIVSRRVMVSRNDETVVIRRILRIRVEEPQRLDQGE